MRVPLLGAGIAAATPTRRRVNSAKTLMVCVEDEGSSLGDLGSPIECSWPLMCFSLLHICSLLPVYGRPNG